MTHPEFSLRTLHDGKRELERAARRASTEKLREEQPAPAADPLVLRLDLPQDAVSLAGLAALEGRPAPAGRYLLAEVDGVVVAALHLRCGRPLRDPSRSTTHLMALLELRARQLEPGAPRLAWLSFARGGEGPSAGFASGSNVCAHPTAGRRP